MDQEWFEMKAIRNRRLETAVWIPLRAIHRIEETGRHGFLGFKTEFFGAGTLGVPIEAIAAANQLGWSDVGISHQHGPYAGEERYIPSDVFDSHVGDFDGLHLVLEQRTNRCELAEWHLNQDLVLALGLMREGDVWVCPDEGYVEVVRLQRGTDGSPDLMEMRAEHLRDYLCARNMALYVTAYRERRVVAENADHITWPENPFREIDGGDRWEGRVYAIHEGGHAYGEKTAVFHVARTDVDPAEDVPSFGLPSDEHTESESWTVEHEERKLWVIQGELWRNEWVQPAALSQRVRGDKLPPTVYFVTDAEGTRENRETLDSQGR